MKGKKMKKGLLFSELIIFIIVLALALTKPAISQTAVEVDIKPGSCPSSINLKKNGVTPIAIVGTEDLDVTALGIDPENPACSLIYTDDSGVLHAIAAVKAEELDSTQPYGDEPPCEEECCECFSAEDAFNCALNSDGEYIYDCVPSEPEDDEVICTAYCGDGYMDLVVYFNTPDLAAILGDAVGCVPLSLVCGDISGTDSARIKEKKTKE